MNGSIAHFNGWTEYDNETRSLSNLSLSEADLELGDFGILFLLFSEGLEVSAERLRSLANYLPLGLAQISLTTAVITAAILSSAAEALDRFIPLDMVSMILFTLRNSETTKLLAMYTFASNQVACASQSRYGLSFNFEFAF